MRRAGNHANQTPALATRERTALFDGDYVAFARLAIFIVSEQLSRAAHVLALVGVVGEVRHTPTLAAGPVDILVR